MCIVKNWPQSGTGFRHDGKPDMILHIQSSSFVFINDAGMSRPAQPL